MATQTPLQELVGRFFGTAIGLEQGQRAQVILGALPSEFNLPLPEGTTVVGSIASGVGAPQSRHIFLDVPLEPQETLEFFRDALAQSGWEPRRPFDQQVSNFLSDGRVIYCKEGSEGFRGLQSSPYEEGVTPVRLFSQDGNAHFFCKDWPEISGAGGVLPALTLPEAQSLQSGFATISTGEPGQGDSVKANLTIRTNKAPGVVEEGFRGQLAESGWLLKEHGGRGPVSWSTWEVPDQPGSTWNGLQVVARMPEGGTTAFFRLHRMVAFEQAAPEAPLVPSTIPENMEALEELVRRFSQLERRQVRLLPEGLPSHFNIPLPPWTRVVGSVVFADEDALPKETQIFLDVAMEPNEVDRFFQEELSKSGWLYTKLVLPVFVSPEGEFDRSRVYTPFCNEEENLSMFLNVIPRQEQRSEVHLRLIGWNRAFCDREAPPDLPTLKVLAGPAPVDLGSGAGRDNVDGDATLVTDLPAAALEEHFRDQLAASGWAIVAQGAGGPTAWSTWRFVRSDGKPWVGLLLVVDLPDGTTSYATLNTAQRESYQWEGRPTGDPTPAPTPTSSGLHELTKLVYRMSVDDPSTEQIEATLEVIRSRLSTFGLDGTVTKAGGNQIAVELRDVSDAELVKRLIGKRAHLVFKERTCADPLCQEFTDSDTLLTGEDVVNAFASTNTQGEWVVNIQFGSRGAGIFSELTERIFTQQDTKRIAIFLDENELFAPVARAWIRDGRIQITGNFSREDASTLAIQLESGRLPVALELISEEVR
ncbi:MAG: hypothetical protein IIC96_17305 [Chloroflexi bacterium]|nr:hypothetical protein [Chloroflexota bacterium]